MFGKKHDHLSSKFLNGLAEQAKGRSAWFFAFLALLFYQFFVISKIESAISNSEKILVPYNVAVGAGEVEFSSDFSVGTDYIKLIAEADALLWGNTRPDNVISRRQMFLKRFHPNLYVQAKEEVLKVANSDKLREVTRSFETTDIFVDNKGRLRIDGVEYVDIAGVEAPPKKTSLIITYRRGGSGYPYISGWEKHGTVDLELK